MSHMGFRRIFSTISLKNFFVERPKLRLEYLSQDESGSLEIFTTDSVKDNEENLRNKFSLEALSFFFVNCKKSYDSLIYIFLSFSISIDANKNIKKNSTTKIRSVDIKLYMIEWVLI